MIEISEFIKSCKKEIEELSSRDLDLIGESYKSLMCKQLKYWESIRDNLLFKYTNKNTTYLVSKDYKLKIFDDNISDTSSLCIAEIPMGDIENLVDKYRNRHGLLD